MEDCMKSKLTIKDVLNIGKETLKNVEVEAVENIPWYFLQKLMALNGIARNTALDQCDTTGQFWDNQDWESDSNTSKSFNPLDILSVLLHCSDSFLQQEIVTKMSMCQFAVPLLLPAGDGPDFTLMLWAMRDIVKRWRPQSLTESKGYKEGSLVQIPMPTFSFVRLGKSTLSKSGLLNKMLSQVQSCHNFFVSFEMECGNIPRKITDGLVEISWYFPGSTTNSEIFPEPIAVINMRGDLNLNWKQFTFLRQVSSVIFIVAESITEKGYNLLSNCRDTETNYYFITTSSSDKQAKAMTQDFLKKLFPVLKINKDNVLVSSNTTNVTDLAKKLQNVIVDYMKNPRKQTKLEDMAVVATEVGIKVDESSAECQNARAHALKITKQIKDVVKYKKETMKLQGDLWKDLSKTEKELCRMKNQGANNADVHKARQRRRWLQLREIQSQHSLPDDMNLFLNAVTCLTPVEKNYFLKWMKFYLDAIARNNLSILQTEHKEKSENSKELKHFHQSISDNSLGIEHFLREIGQFYESQCFILEQKNVNKTMKQLYQLPAIAADLLLDGYPLELIDGDASNIPLKWISNVLAELDDKTGGRCRIRVISVLGVQSTGKSTLLNTMFGLQFPVANGRCTRGAFMTLLQVKDNLQKELGCNFILVIDTEGLKAPELASLEDCPEHDNELATLVVGLSDITIVNMSMENTAEMKDTLQIVVHAFLRMNEIGKKPICQLVHQNVSDVTAHDKNKKSREALLQELNELTRIAAKMEKKKSSIRFSDIIDYDPDKHSWYIPGLWHGAPPMAPINSGYSEHVQTFKTHLFQLLKETSSPRPQNISSFIEWINSLWNAVKYETFIFSFMNSLVAEAYEQLSMKYSELEWNFTKRVHDWLSEKETYIKNQPTNKVDAVTSEILSQSMNAILDKQEALMTKQLTEFFGKGCYNVHLIERYREDFLNSVNCLRRKLEARISNKCTEVSRIQTGKHMIKNIQENSTRVIEEKIHNCLKNRKLEKCELSDRELNQEFETVWNMILSELQVQRLKKHRVDQEILELLKKEMRTCGPAINQRLQNVKCLLDYGKNPLVINKDDMDFSYFSMMALKHFFTSNCCKQLADITSSLQILCQQYVEETVNSAEDYSETYGQELLKMINNRLAKDDIKKLHPTAMFQLKLKLHILGTAASQFQKMHDDFGQNNDPKLLLNKLRPQYFDVFRNIFQRKDESKIRAKEFCEKCLQPAIIENINRTLGKEVLDEFLKSVDATIYKTRRYLQYNILKELLERKSFEKYLEYVISYEMFLKKWIYKQILEKYKSSAGLEKLQLHILQSLIRKIRAALKDPTVQRCDSITDFLENFCTVLIEYLVISQNAMNVIVFQNTSNISQFSADIDSYLTQMEGKIWSSMKALSTESVLSSLQLKPQNELFKKVIGCGKKCPFCYAPCEAEGAKHKEHFASAHRPKGLAQATVDETNSLCSSTCSNDIICNSMFANIDTGGEWHPFKDYRKIYPNWIIYPERNMDASNYWKFVLKEFNNQFAQHFNAKPANISKEWQNLTENHAFYSLKQMYHMK
ncbi:up-regulator of cell proliferation-like [Discoglossus pictus]